MGVSIWDTAGQEKMFRITANLLQGIHGVVLVYDCTNEDSFHSVRSWFSQLRESSPKAKVVLLGNKMDLRHHEVVSSAQGKELANEYKVPFFESSAVTGESVKEAMVWVML